MSRKRRKLLHFPLLSNLLTYVLGWPMHDMSFYLFLRMYPASSTTIYDVPYFLIFIITKIVPLIDIILKFLTWTINTLVVFTLYSLLWQVSTKYNSLAGKVSTTKVSFVSLKIYKVWKYTPNSGPSMWWKKCPLVIVIGSYCCAPVNSNFEENYFTLSDEKRVLFTYRHIFSGGEVTLKNAIMLRIPLL